jgi:quercetin dioxygenase-like cupin family protein
MKQLRFMNVSKPLALAVLGAIAAVVAGVALATPGSGVLSSSVIARGTLGPHFKIKLRDSSGPGDLVAQQIVFAPGGQSGWHMHPGPALVTVTSGEVTFQQASDCSNATYSTGQVAIEEAGVIHRARNLGTTNAEILVTFLDVPVSSPQRIEASDPGC